MDNKEKDAFFIMLPRSLMQRENLSLHWKVALGYILTRINLPNWLICAADVSNESGVSKQEVSRLFTALESTKTIHYVKTRCNGPKRYKEYSSTPAEINRFAEMHGVWTGENPQSLPETANPQSTGETAKQSAVPSGDCGAIGSPSEGRTIREEKEEENKQEGISTKVLDKGGSGETSVETSSASIQGAEGDSVLNIFNEVFPDSSSVTSSNALGSVLNWDELKDVYAASGVSALGSNEDASTAPPGRKNPYKIQELHYASGSKFSVSPPASVCTRPVGPLPKSMGTHYGANRV